MENLRAELGAAKPEFGWTWQVVMTAAACTIGRVQSTAFAGAFLAVTCSAEILIGSATEGIGISMN